MNRLLRISCGAPLVRGKWYMTKCTNGFLSAALGRPDPAVHGFFHRYTSRLLAVVGLYGFDVPQEGFCYDVVRPFMVHLRPVEALAKAPRGLHVPGGSDWTFQIKPELLGEFVWSADLVHVELLDNLWSWWSWHRRRGADPPQH